IRRSHEIRVAPQDVARFDHALAEAVLLNKEAERTIDSARAHSVFSANRHMFHHPPQDEFHLPAIWRVRKVEELLRGEQLHLSLGRHEASIDVRRPTPPSLPTP